jgi:hypothetical protein
MTMKNNNRIGESGNIPIASRFEMVLYAALGCLNLILVAILVDILPIPSVFVAAVGLVLTGFRATGNPSTIYSVVMILLSMAAALGLCLAAVARLRGNKQPFWAYLIACLFLGLRLFDRCRGWSEVPQTGLYLFPFLASVCLLLAFFYISAMQVDLPNRRMSLFFSLISIYLCIVCLAFSDELLFYLCMIVFLATNLPNLRPIKKPKAVPDQPDVPQQAPSNSAEMSYDELMDWLKNG